MRRKDEGVTGLFAVAIIALVAYGLFKRKAQPTKPVVKTSIFNPLVTPTLYPLTVSDKTVKTGGYTMLIPKDVTVSQQQQYQEAFSDYVSLYNNSPSKNTLDSPGTAAGQERAMINYAQTRTIQAMLAQEPYIPGLNYKAVFGFDYPFAPGVVEQAKVLGVTPDVVAAALAEGNAIAAMY